MHMEAINETEPDAAESIVPPEGTQAVDLSELLIAMKNAVERMSTSNTHRGVMVTAGSVIIHLVTENRRLVELLDAYAKAAPTTAASSPLVSLT